MKRTRFAYPKIPFTDLTIRFDQDKIKGKSKLNTMLKVTQILNDLATTLPSVVLLTFESKARKHYIDQFKWHDDAVWYSVGFLDKKDLEAFVQKLKQIALKLPATPNTERFELRDSILPLMDEENLEYYQRMTPNVDLTTIETTRPKRKRIPKGGDWWVLLSVEEDEEYGELSPAGEDLLNQFEKVCQSYGGKPAGESYGGGEQVDYAFGKDERSAKKAFSAAKRLIKEYPDETGILLLTVSVGDEDAEDVAEFSF